MSLWQAEVEKSRFSPDSTTNRKRGLLERFLHGGIPDKAQNKTFTPHSGIAEYTYPARPRPAPKLKPIQTNHTKEDARLFRTYQNEAAKKPSVVPMPHKMSTSKLPKTPALPKTPTLPRFDLDLLMDHPPRTETAESAEARANIDQIANLIIQKSRLEQDIKERETRYHYLLTESQNLTKTICADRDLARQEVDSLKIELAQSKLANESAPQKSRYSLEELEKMLQPHDDFYYKDGFRQLEKAIRTYILNAMQLQPDVLRMVDLNPSVEFYLQKHNLKTLSVFGIRDVRCIVCRGFIMEFLLERVFRVFLFGMVQGIVFKEGFQALCAIDIGKGSKWASNVARLLVTSSSDYNPEKAAKELMMEIKLYLAPFIDLKKAPGLEEVVEKAIELARDLRLDLASFSLEMPAYGVPFETKRMICSPQERGAVAIAFSPIVTRRGNRRGCDYHIGFVIAKGKVWRDSIFAELQDLRPNPNEEYDSQDEDNY